MTRELHGTYRAVASVLSVALLLAVPTGCPASDRAAQAASAPRPDRLRLATWNVEWLAAADGDGEVPRGPEDYARLAETARRLDADVIALQEVDGEAAARRILDPERYRFHFAAGGGVQRSGLAIDRRLGFLAHADVAPLAVSGLRPGADATVRWRGGALRVLSIHLKAGCAWDPLDSGRPQCATLGRQLRALEEWIDARAREDAPFAVLGDFNRQLHAGDAFWTEIDDGDPPGADLVNLTEGRRSRCRGGRYPRYVDHIVLDPRATAWIEPGSFAQLLYGADPAAAERLSDHCPLVVTLRPK